ncbi:hypothetical protein [Methylomonas sp. MgM2]
MAQKSFFKWFRLVLNGLIAGLTVAYPFLIWLSLDYFQPRTLALILAGLFALRILSAKDRSTDRITRLIVPICVLFLLAIAWLNRTGGLMIYPVLVSLSFFFVFSVSLVYPPTVVERLARLEDPDLPAQGIVYTRKVTQVWSAFFLGNAAVSLFTVWYGDRWLWSLYNGCVFYILMGLLMTAEMAVRRKVKASY